jgi:hypothetical protein
MRFALFVDCRDEDVEMTTQELTVTADEDLTLHLLRCKHADAGFVGRCIVRFAPELFLEVTYMPGFRYVDDYRFTKPVDENEIGGVEVFHLVPASPIKYVDADIR